MSKKWYFCFGKTNTYCTYKIAYSKMFLSFKASVWPQAVIFSLIPNERERCQSLSARFLSVPPQPINYFVKIIFIEFMWWSLSKCFWSFFYGSFNINYLAFFAFAVHIICLCSLQISLCGESDTVPIKKYYPSRIFVCFVWIPVDAIRPFDNDQLSKWKRIHLPQV